MDISTTRLLEQGMAMNQAGIEEAWRCDHCDGHGQISVGCAITHSIYNPCVWCFGTGRKPTWDALDELHRAVELEARFQEARALQPSLADDHYGRVWFKVLVRP